MNWYKKAQLSTIDVLEDHGESYLSIGHEGEYGNEYDEKNPNYMWVFVNGEILSVEESSENPGHQETLFPGYDPDRLFSGRFNLLQEK